MLSTTRSNIRLIRASCRIRFRTRSSQSQATHTPAPGLGGRPITRASLTAVLDRAVVGDLPDLTFLDLDEALLAREGALADVERLGADEAARTPAEVAP